MIIWLNGWPGSAELLAVVTRAVDGAWIKLDPAMRKGRLVAAGPRGEETGHDDFVELVAGKRAAGRSPDQHRAVEDAPSSALVKRLQQPVARKDPQICAADLDGRPGSCDQAPAEALAALDATGYHRAQPARDIMLTGVRDVLRQDVQGRNNNAVIGEDHRHWPERRVVRWPHRGQAAAAGPDLLLQGQHLAAQPSGRSSLREGLDEHPGATSLNPRPA